MVLEMVFTCMKQNNKNTLTTKHLLYIKTNLQDFTGL